VSCFRSNEKNLIIALHSMRAVIVLCVVLCISVAVAAKPEYAASLLCPLSYIGQRPPGHSDGSGAFLFHLLARWANGRFDLPEPRTIPHLVRDLVTGIMIGLQARGAWTRCSLWIRISRKYHNPCLLWRPGMDLKQLYYQLVCHSLMFQAYQLNYMDGTSSCENFDWFAWPSQILQTPTCQLSSGTSHSIVVWFLRLCSKYVQVWIMS